MPNKSLGISPAQTVCELVAVSRAFEESSFTVIMIVCSAVQPETEAEYATTLTASPLEIEPGVAEKVATADAAPCDKPATKNS